MKIQNREKNFSKFFFTTFSLLFTLHTFLKGFCEGVKKMSNDFQKSIFSPCGMMSKVLILGSINTPQIIPYQVLTLFFAYHRYIRKSVISPRSSRFRCSTILDTLKSFSFLTWSTKVGYVGTLFFSIQNVENPHSLQ